jgi:hypothetical protein
VFESPEKILHGVPRECDGGITFNLRLSVATEITDSRAFLENPGMTAEEAITMSTLEELRSAERRSKERCYFGNGYSRSGACLSIQTRQRDHLSMC